MDKAKMRINEIFSNLKGELEEFYNALTDAEEELKDIKKQTGKKSKEAYQYHGRAIYMPKRLREYFSNKGIAFEDNEFVDVYEYVEIELVNRWSE
jgi:hypothetical protein